MLSNFLIKPLNFMVIMFIVSQFYIFFTTDYTMADWKRKLETDDSNLENSPKRRKSYSVEQNYRLFLN